MLKIKFAFLLALALLSAGALASYEGQNAVLLIAVSEDEVNASRSFYFRRWGESGTEEFERIFNSRMQSLSLQPIIKYSAKASDLSQALTHPNNAAVFWLGHSNGDDSAIDIQSDC